MSSASTLALARQFHTAIRRQVEHEWALDEIEASGAVRTLRGAAWASSVSGRSAPRIAGIAARVRHAGVGNPQTADPAAARRALMKCCRPNGCPNCSPGAMSWCCPHRSTHETLAPDRQAARSDAIKPGALLINIGRGKLMDDEAVMAALEDGRLGGAALDVFTREPLDPVEPLLGPAERDRHAAHVRRDGGLLDSSGSPVCRQPPPVRSRRAAAERGRQASRATESGHGTISAPIRGVSEPSCRRRRADTESSACASRRDSS